VKTVSHTVDGRRRVRAISNTMKRLCRTEITKKLRGKNRDIILQQPRAHILPSNLFIK
jgi:hypothetical protein